MSTSPLPPPSVGDRPAPPARSRVGAGWIAFIVLDVVLVVTAVAFGIAFFAGGQGASPGGSPSSAALSSGEPSASETSPADATTFASPSRNITCELSSAGVTCSIAALDTRPAPVDGCDGTVGYRVTLDEDGVEQPCVPKRDQPEAAPDDIALLAYGESESVGNYRCDSERTGVTCRDETTGRGFTLAKAGIGAL